MVKLCFKPSDHCLLLQLSLPSAGKGDYTQIGSKVFLKSECLSLIRGLRWIIFPSCLRGRGYKIGPVCLSGCRQGTLYTTPTVYGLLVHQEGSLCTTQAQYAPRCTRETMFFEKFRGPWWFFVLVVHRSKFKVIGCRNMIFTRKKSFLEVHGHQMCRM